MLFTTLALSTLLSLTTAQSAPISPSNATDATSNNIVQLRKTNRIAQVAGGPKPPGPVALSAVYAKYNKTIPTPVVSAAVFAKVSATRTATLQSGSVVATNTPNDELYLVPVTVGKTQMMLDIDTGSSDFWVFSSKLSAAQRGSHAYYKLGGTKEAGQNWGISYGDGSAASGIVFNDTVNLGGIVNPAQDIEVATAVTNSFTTGDPDGLIGLGFPEGNTCYPNRCVPFITAIAPSLPSPVFAAALRYNAPGVYDFGFIDPTLYYGPMAYTGVNDNLGGGYWEFNSGGYSVGNATKTNRKMDIIADTGTSLLLADDVIVTAFYANVQGAAYNASYGAIIFPCSEASKLADLSYYIGGAKHTMPGEYGIYGQVTSPEGYCYGGVQSNSGFGFTIMGDVFLKSQVVAFQTQPPRIGFAQSVFARDLLQ